MPHMPIVIQSSGIRMKWPTLHIVKKIVLRIAPVHLVHAIAAQTTVPPKL